MRNRIYRPTLKLSKWHIIGVISLLSTVLSCDKPPYHEFEERLSDSICRCVELNKYSSNQEKFAIQYEDCMNETSMILKNGLDEYEEDTRLSKEDYLNRIEDIIKEAALSCL